MATEKKEKPLQDRFLEQLRTKKVRCTLFTMNGVQIHGFVRSYDAYSVLMDNPDKNKQDFIYKHAISTISPNEFVRLDEAGDKE